MQVGPDGNSPSCVAHLPFWGAEMRPTPPMPTFHSLAPLVLPTALSTSQVFCKLQLSKPPTYRALSLGVWERVPFLLLLSSQLTLNSGGSSKSGSLVAIASPLDSEFLWEG